MRPHLIAALGLVALCCSSSPGLAKAPKLTPAKMKQIKKSRKSFEACRKDALTQLKGKKIDKAVFEAQVETCTEHFPGASLYISCKKAAIKTAASKGISPQEEAEQCKRYLLAASFDPKEPVPVFIEQDKLYVAGIGMNQRVPVAGLKPPNFDCESLPEVSLNPASAQYILFGNHPQLFTGLTDLDGPGLVKALKFKKVQPKGVDRAGFGRIFGDPKSAASVAYFPAAACDFDAELGETFAGISNYYLLDGTDKSATPYFGIVYYKSDQKAVTTPQLVKAVLQQLGSGFKSFKKNAQVTFIATESVKKETDEEGDPKNLCRPPRPHHFVAVVQGRKDAPLEPEFLLVASVKNLCDFGDVVGKRLVP